ncbi:short-chain dehydrogenase/reductase 2, putative [Talaromyces stipitatus ATCC 10500]|uniref:Short-chain dehydrogenase/reductase 3 n=1 Tax=Talaromyces stipitatus (strain ATCC 10500 / CBS 375.48 / QM 6759 / NRRL 1006) TaxID=441959 RepID=B8MAC9_TALSN|nr:short-chain dehydrogenase/reductase 2, putative [Talaromyces stipitatus ATCC 10500]EED18631.1 short-chain dehydrogenase/reductase 2, putative [Talaromyces stipitatus ATCC 10500]
MDAITTAQKLSQDILQKLHPSAQRILLSSTTRNVLAVVLALYLLKTFNRALSRSVLNNWTSDKYDWSREIVLVTGGCSGIGQSLAHQLANRGVKVIVADIQEPTTPLPKNVYFYKCDVTSTTSIQQAGAQIRADHGDPTVLINNAGVGKEGSILEKPESVVRLVFEVNTLAHWWTVREFLPAMIKRNHGHVVTIASAGSFLGVGEMVDYSCSKASALAFHEGLTQEIRFWYKAKKIRTSIIHPFWVKTPLTKPITDSGAELKQPMLDVEDVAGIIVEHVLSGNSGQISIPDRVGVGAMIRGFPNWLQEWIRSLVSSDLKRVRDLVDAKDGI